MPLKSKYTFKHNTNTLHHLHDSLSKTFTDFMQTNPQAMINKYKALALLSIKPFIDRVLIRSLGDNEKVQIHIKKTEALAFHLLYKDDVIDDTNYLIQEIFTAIDKTL